MNLRATDIKDLAEFVAGLDMLTAKTGFRIESYNEIRITDVNSDDIAALAWDSQYSVYRLVDKS